MFRTEHYLWVEKYRPKTLDTFIGNDHIKNKIKNSIENRDIGNLLFFGPAGTGKTTLAKIITSNIECDYLYINASDENGIETIRTKIKGFASTAGFNDLKIVILDEADFLTPNAQAALRNTAETFSMSTRFILTCNYIERIIDPLKSRCQTFEVIPPSKKEIAIHVANILNQENVKYQKEDLALIINANYPDIRKIINELQSNTVDNVLKLDVKALIESNYLLKIFEVLKNKTFDKKQSFRTIRQILADSKVRHFEDLYKYFYDNLTDLTSDELVQSGIILIIAEGQYQDSFVVDKEINVMAVLVKIINELKS